MANFPDFWRGGGSFFRDTNQMQRMMERLFDDPALRARNTTDAALWSPSCELTEDKESFTARFEIPGVTKDQIKVELHDGQLLVHAERKSEKKDEKKHYSEFSYGSYMRAFNLPAPVSEERVEAGYENGILTVKMQKKTPGGARQISVR